MQCRDIFVGVVVVLQQHVTLYVPGVNEQKGTSFGCAFPKQFLHASCFEHQRWDGYGNILPAIYGQHKLWCPRKLPAQRPPTLVPSAW